MNLGYLDDLAIAVASASFDGPGGLLAYAGTCARGASSGDPVLGVVFFDSDDVARLGQNSLTGIALHEIAHVLGIGVGTNWYSSIVNPSTVDPDADSHFPGTRAVAAFDSAGGTGYSGGKVPVQGGGDDAH